MTLAFLTRSGPPEPPGFGVEVATGMKLPAPGSALLVITRGPDAGARLALDKAVTRVGRHPNSDVFLDDATVSRRHAEFRVTGDNDVQVIDLGSLNGTHVNGRPMDSAALTNGDEIELGKFHLVFLSGGPALLRDSSPRG